MHSVLSPHRLDLHVLSRYLMGSKQFWIRILIFITLTFKRNIQFNGRKMQFKLLFIANLDRLLTHFVVANTTGQISSTRTGKKNIDQRQGLFPDAFSNAAFVIQAQRYAYPLPILFGTISIISYHLDAMYKRILEIFGGIFLINAMFSRKHFLKVI